jgi:DNA-binding NtrC family response regulator
MKIQTDIECAITTEENVLISGGNSAARTALARLIHQRSSRRDRSWVILESKRPIQPASEADEARLVPDAAGRTLFIEELATLDGSAQDDLMRLLDRSADADPLIDDVRVTRIISSTAHNPVERLAGNLFDTGLFYRLNTIHIALGDERRLASPTTVH